MQKTTVTTKKSGCPVRVVLGGSFNPPTLAHRDLALHAARHVEKATGREARPALVPSSDAYVRRKMSRQLEHGYLFSENARRDMLIALMYGQKTDIDTLEYGDDGRGHTYRTMRRLQDTDPENEYMFLMGADKLGILPRWHDIEAFLSEFMFIVTARDGNSAKAMIARDPLLSRYAGSFIVIPELTGPNAGFSSTEARRAMGESTDMSGIVRICGDRSAAVVKRELDAKRAPDLSRTAPPKKNDGGRRHGK